MTRRRSPVGRAVVPALAAAMLLSACGPGSWLARGPEARSDGAVAAPTFRCKATEERPKGTPCRIAIPSIGVDANVIRLGLEPSGRLEVPSDFSETGWWSGGTIPGEVGPAVIVGHVDSKRGPAVFYRLRELRRGAEVLVWRAGAGVVRFAVDGKSQFPKDAFPSEMVYGGLDFAGLRLVTCGGRFNDATGHYVDNVIVFARRVA